ncbi:MAG TPA: 6-carboxytetrahydropterin synthase [Bryobacterales bacterium]|nr:6-carboxytetrahydropterin synthase [Bryobacterales bacterium]
MRLTRRYPFSASHRLHTAELSEEENEKLFGKCNNPYGHGHNYVLEVSIEGEPDDRTGMIVERRVLDDFVRRRALSRVDHVDLNNDVEEFQDAVPTTENLSLAMHGWLKAGWNAEFGNQEAKLGRIRIEETARNHFEVTA